jgi:hypothetical protein
MSLNDRSTVEKKEPWGMYHVAALDRAFTSVVVSTPPGGWILPFTTVHRTERVPPAIDRLLKRLDLTGQLIHEDAVVYDAARALNHAYCAVAVDTPTLPEGLMWRSISSLTSSGALLPIQHEMLTLCLARLRCPTEPFDACDHLHAITSWVTTQLNARGLEIVGAPVRYRATRSDSVIEFETTAGRAYFKGGAWRWQDEVRLAQALAQCAPEHVPYTIAADPERCWWLTLNTDGQSLDLRTADDDLLVQVVELIASLQQKVLDEPHVLQVLSDRPLTARRLREAWDTLCAMAMATTTARSATTSSRADADQDADADITQAQIDLVHSCVADTCDVLEAASLPPTWIHSDLWSPNIVVRPGRQIYFVDLEDYYLGPPPLALYRLLRDIRQTSPNAERLIPLLTRTYVDAWRSSSLSASIASAFDHMDVLYHVMRSAIAFDNWNRRPPVNVDIRRDLHAKRLAYARRTLARIVEAAGGELHHRSGFRADTSLAQEIQP